MIKINHHHFKTLEVEGSEEAKDKAMRKEMEEGHDLVFENKGVKFGEEFDFDPELSKICGTCKSHGKGAGCCSYDRVRCHYIEIFFPLK